MGDPGRTSSCTRSSRRYPGTPSCRRSWARHGLRLRVPHGGQLGHGALLHMTGNSHTDSVDMTRQLAPQSSPQNSLPNAPSQISLHKALSKRRSTRSSKFQGSYNALIRLLQGKLSQSSCKALARSLHEAFSTRPSTRVLSERLSPGQRTSGF